MAAFDVTFMAVLAGGSGTGLLVLLVLPASSLPLLLCVPFFFLITSDPEAASVPDYQTSWLKNTKSHNIAGFAVRNPAMFADKFPRCWNIIHKRRYPRTWYQKLP